MQGATAENEAIALDRAGQYEGAIAKYEECERHFAMAVGFAQPDHAQDQPKLQAHREQVLSRLVHLKSLNGAESTVPVEDQIKTIQLGMQAAQSAERTAAAAVAATESAGGMGTLGAVSAIGAGVGFLALGPLGLIAGAAGSAYMATRQDGVGATTRQVGSTAITAAQGAKELDQKHRVSQNLMAAGGAAATQIAETNQKYGITDKISTGVGAAASRLSQIEREHHVTEKMAAGLSAGLSAVTRALSPRQTQSVASRPSGSGADPRLS